MRFYKDEIKNKMANYLMTEVNRRAEEIGLDLVEHLDSGLWDSMSSAPVPVLYLFVGARHLSQSFFDTYNCRIGICFGCGTPMEGLEKADKWEDIIEDVFRASRGLGDSCLMWTNEPVVNSVGEPGMWMTTCDFDVEVDLEKLG